MQKIAISNSLLIRFILIILVTLVFIFLLSIKNQPKILGSSEYSLYTGNVGIGESPPAPTPTPTATASATPYPTPTSTPTPSPDTEDPIVDVTNPTNGSSVSGLVEVRAEASDNVAVASVSFFVDVSPIGTDISAPYSVYWDTTVYPHNSQHAIHATALDTSGNQASSSAVIYVNVLDVTAPSVTITSPLDGSTVRKNSTVTITANASDISGIQKVEFYVNGVLTCTDTTSSYSCNWKVPKRPFITYTLLAKAYDIAGNTQSSFITITSK